VTASLPHFYLKTQLTVPGHFLHRGARQTVERVEKCKSCIGTSASIVHAFSGTFFKPYLTPGGLSSLSSSLNLSVMLRVVEANALD
jgi:hypothetical protein